jgi:hypothetical protein
MSLNCGCIESVQSAASPPVERLALSSWPDASNCIMTTILRSTLTLATCWFAIRLYALSLDWGPVQKVVLTIVLALQGVRAPQLVAQNIWWDAAYGYQDRPLVILPHPGMAVWWLLGAVYLLALVCLSAYVRTIWRCSLGLTQFIVSLASLVAACWLLSQNSIAPDYSVPARIAILLVAALFIVAIRVVASASMEQKNPNTHSHNPGGPQ